MLKICFYLSGNQRNFWKMSEIEQKCTLLLSILIFQFWFFSVFFGFQLLLQTFWQNYRTIFWFFVLYGRKIHFCIINDNKFCKNPKNVHFYCRYLFFNFVFCSVFFSRFFFLYDKKMYFLLLNSAIFAKPKESLRDRLFITIFCLITTPSIEMHFHP